MSTNQSILLFNVLDISVTTPQAQNYLSKGYDLLVYYQ